MKQNFRLSHLSFSVGLTFALGVTSSFAQITPPDAGSLSTNPVAPPSAPPRTPTFEIQQEVRPALAAPGGVKVRVESFKISGNTVFSEATLLAVVSDYVGKDLDLAGLDEAASAISQYYRQQGYFVARAYLPAQEVASGNLEIAVIEGRLGAVRFNRSGETRLSEERAQAFIAGATPANAPIRAQNIERGLMLLNDVPGVEVKSTLVPGATPGTSDLVVETIEGRLLTGSVDADNFGNKYTGTFRAGATANLNDPLGIGDQLTVRGLTSGSGLGYGRVAYSLPVGNLGTRFGVAYSTMDYKLGKDFAPLNASGKSNVTSLYAVQPFIRSRNSNLYGTATYDTKRLKDEQLGVNVTDKKVNVFALGVVGDLRDALGGGGVSSASLSYAAGKLDVGGNVNYAANDALTARTDGSYSKVNYSVSRLQRLTDSWSLYGAFSGQFANKNLDTSEKFVLGGQGVRAYPQGEASGDEGMLLNIEARYNLQAFDFGNVQLIGFIDTGRTTLHKNLWSTAQPIGLPNYPNSYTLSGAGFGLNVFRDNNFSVRASVAWRLGSNPGADALGNDSDGSSKRPRFWIQLNKQFN